MPKLGSFTANILVNDVPLEEFAVTSERDNVHSCWISSQEGSNFQVFCHVAPSFETYAAYVYMDGHFMNGTAYKPTHKRDCTIRGCQINANEVRLFAFSKVSLTDDETIAPVDRQIPGLGTIEVKFRRVAITGQSNYNCAVEPDLSNTSVLHERSKKMGMHRVAFQGTEIVPPTTTLSVQVLEEVATFIFRYRPRAFLCAQGIIPTLSEENNGESSSSSTTQAQGDAARPQEKKRKRTRQDASGNNAVIDLDDDDDTEEEEMRKLRKQMLDARARLADLERRKGTRVKTEVKSEPVATVSFVVDSNGVIDLSDD